VSVARIIGGQEERGFNTGDAFRPGPKERQTEIEAHYKRLDTSQPDGTTTKQKATLPIGSRDCAVPMP